MVDTMSGNITLANIGSNKFLEEIGFYNPFENNIPLLRNDQCIPFVIGTFCVSMHPNITYCYFNDDETPIENIEKKKEYEQKQQKWFNPRKNKNKVRNLFQPNVVKNLSRNIPMVKNPIYTRKIRN